LDSLLRLFEKLDEFGLIQRLEEIVGRSQLQSIAQSIQR
jgi:hypothetical protein